MSLLPMRFASCITYCVIAPAVFVLSFLGSKAEMPQTVPGAPSVYVQTAHARPFDTLVVTKGGHYAASRESSGTIYLWDLWDRTQVRRIESSAGYNAISFTADGAFLAVVVDGGVHCYGLNGATDYNIELGPTSTAYTFSPDGKWVAWGDIYGDVQLIDLKNPTKSYPLRVVPHPDTLSLFDVNSTIEKARAAGTIVTLLRFSSDSRDLATTEFGKSVSVFWGLKGPGISLPVPSEIKVQDMVFTSNHEIILGALRSSEAGPIIFNGGDLEVLSLKHLDMPMISIPSEKGGQVALDQSASRVAILNRHSEVGADSATALRVWNLLPLKEISLAKTAALKTLETPIAFVGNRDTLLLRLQPASQLQVLSIDSDTAYHIESSPLLPVEQLAFIHGYLAISRQFLTSLYGLTDGRILYRESRASRVAISERAQVTVQVEADGVTYLQSAKLPKLIKTPVTGGNYGAMRVTDMGDLVWTTDNGYGGSTWFWRVGQEAAQLVCNTATSFVAKSPIAVSPTSGYAAAACTMENTQSRLVIVRMADGKIVHDELWKTEYDLPITITSLDFNPKGDLLAVGDMTSVHLVAVESETPARTVDWPPERNVDLVRFASDDGSLMIASRKASSSDSTVMYEDAINRKTTTIRCKSAITALAARQGIIAIGSDDGTTRVIDTHDLSREITVADSAMAGWVATTPDGLFDGTAGAIKWVGWQDPGSLHVTPLESFYNDYYTPGLFQLIFARELPHAQLDIASTIRVPGMRAMVASGQAHVEDRGGFSVVCLKERPDAALKVTTNDRRVFRTRAGYEAGPDDDCPFQKSIGPQKESAKELNARLKAWHPMPIVELSKEGISETTASTLHVLTIGISNYGHSSGYDDLPYAVPSARAIETFFKSFEASHSSRFKAVKVWDGIYDGNATLANLQVKLARLGYDVKPNDVVLIYFAGHGEVAASNEMFYFVPSDGSEADLRNTGFTTAMFADAIKGLAARRVVLIVDSCQSGGALESLEKVGYVKVKFEELRSRGSDSPTSKPSAVGVHTIMAALPLSYAVGTGDQHESAMAKVLQDWLHSQQSSPTIGELERYIVDALPSLSERDNGGYRQIPMVSAVGADFALRP